MLPLNDSLWQKLDDAHRDRDIPALLLGLARSWDHEAANSLFWDCLCHQQTCYGATYAAMPHLLRIAQSASNRIQRLDIALFLGFVVLCALDGSPDAGSERDDGSLPGLPLNADAWDRKLDCYRSLLANIEARQVASHYEKTELLPRYRKILATGPVLATEFEKIRSIRADFLSALPAIRALCKQSLLESSGHKEVLYLLSGIAAADGLRMLARLLHFGDEGRFSCASCGWDFEYIRFRDRVAIYAIDRQPTRLGNHIILRGDRDRSLSDLREQSPSRSDGFITPIIDSAILARRATALLVLAKQTAIEEPALLLRHLLGSFVCCKCNQQQAICTV